MPPSQSAGWLSAAALLGVAILPGQATAAVLHVATNANFTGPSCGPVDRPCRSISAAARNATNGDSIEVGPGVYGDVDGDGDANGSGEEAAVVVDKAVNVYSLEGAARTIIRSPRVQQRSRVVLIGSGSAGGSFGRPGGGFTIVGDKSAAPGGTGGLQNNASDMTIAGNVFTNNASYGLVSASPRVRVEGNIAADNGGTGFDLASTDLVATGNLAARNQIGFALNARWTTFSDNQALANVQFGVQINTGNVAQITGSFIGNGIAGINGPLSMTGVLEIHQSNIYGNGDAALGCGLLNQTGNVIDASNNYWGKADGPGPNPGDRAFGACVVSGDTVATPFSTVPFALSK